MSLESILTKLVEAIDKNTAALLNRAPAPTTETATAATVTTAAITKPQETSAGGTITPQPEKPKPTGATEEDITALMQVLLDKGKKADLKALNAEFGVERGRMLFGTDKMQPYFDRLTALNT